MLRVRVQQSLRAVCIATAQTFARTQFVRAHAASACARVPAWIKARTRSRVPVRKTRIHTRFCAHGMLAPPHAHARTARRHARSTRASERQTWA